MRARLLFALIVAFASAAQAVEPEEMLADPALEARARAITEELRCVVCQNQSVDDSDAPLAHDIRVLVRERIKAGDTDDQARNYIVARYGKFVLLRPPFEADTFVLWLAPFALLAIAGGLAFAYIRRNDPNTTPALTPAEEAALKRKLDEAAQ